jgi:transcriptional regulator with XRE-family HTH domain
MVDIGAQLGARIKSLRSDRGFSQSELADAADISEEWVRRLERGAKAPSIATLAAISKALGVSIASLFAWHGDEEARFQALLAEAENLTDDQLRWLEAAARLASKMP